MAIADDLMDRLKAALVSTSATDGDGAPAIRVQFVAATSAAITTGAMPDDLMDRLKGACVSTSATDGDGAPALRARSV